MTYALPEPLKGYSVSWKGLGDDDKNDEEIEDAIKKVRLDGVKMLLVILDTKSAAIGARVKRWGDVGNGMSYESHLNYFADMT